MQSAGLRRREKPSTSTHSAGNNIDLEYSHSLQTLLHDSSGHGKQPATFTVDLSLKPEDRYSHIIPHLLPHIKGAKLTDLFDDLISQIAPGPVASIIRRSASVLLRRVYSDEETAELQGIAKGTDIPMYLLVAFNVLLDLLLGCTSGGVRVEEPVASSPGGNNPGTAWRSRMIHFRTLDWGMDPLREIVVELDFVRHPGGPVIATTVGYFGYVGVLTGVREGLSMSLNFRPHHDGSTWRKRADFRRHQLMVVLGFRPSISSTLRSYLFSKPHVKNLQRKKSTRSLLSIRQRKRDNESDVEVAEEEDSAEKVEKAPIIERILAELSCSASTSAYLIFCTPQTVYSVEKDNGSAFVRSSDTFLTTYNHDAADENDATALAAAAHHLSQNQAATGMEDIVEYSLDRKGALDKVFRRCLNRRRRKLGRGPKDRPQAVGMEDVLEFVRDSWVTNEETHYSVIMDSQHGKMIWKRMFQGVNSESGSEV